MAKTIKKGLYFFLIPLVVILLFVMLIIKILNPGWVFELSNNYFIRKANNTVELVKKVDDEYYTEYKNKTVGISSYVAEFQYNKNFVGIKSIEIVNEESVVYFYLVDTKNDEIRGPYTDEETYLAVLGVWSKEGLGEWISTLDNPNK